MEVLPHDQFVVRIDNSRRLARRNRRFLRLYNSISTNIDAKAYIGWRQDQPSSQEDNVSHQSSDSPSMFSDDSNDARKKKVTLAQRSLKDFMPQFQIGDTNKGRMESRLIEYV